MVRALWDPWVVYHLLQDPQVSNPSSGQAQSERIPSDSHLSLPFASKNSSLKWTMLLPTPTPARDSTLPQEQASHPWSGQQQASRWDRNRVIPRPGVAEVEAGCLGRMPHGLCLHFPAQIFPKHKAFLFPLELLRNTHMLQSWEKETRRLK